MIPTSAIKILSRAMLLATISLACGEPIPSGTTSDEIVFRIGNQKTTTIDTVRFTYSFYYAGKNLPEQTISNILLKVAPSTKRYITLDASKMQGLKLTPQEATATIDMTVSKYRSNATAATFRVWELSEGEPSFLDVTIKTDSVIVETPSLYKVLK